MENGYGHGSGNGNGNGTKTLWAVLLAAGTLIGNGAVWVVSRMAQMDDDRQRMAVAVEQRLGRVEGKIERLMEMQGWWQREQSRARRLGSR